MCVSRTILKQSWTLRRT